MDKIRYVAIDPGTTKSGLATFDIHHKIIHSQKLDNELVLTFLEKLLDINKKIVIFIERISAQGKTGRSTILTVLFCGYLLGRLHAKGFHDVQFATRQRVKKVLLGKGKWKDKHVRARLIELYGCSKIATLKVFAEAKGSLFVATDAWSALALFVAGMKDPSILSKEF